MSFIDFVKSPAFLLAVIFVLAVLYSLYAKIRDGKAAKAAPAPVKNAPAAATTTAAPAGVSNGELDLIETDEKTAAVIMAIVSNKSGIPLNRLSFKSIRLMEDK
jgi:hypothetical protein